MARRIAQDQAHLAVIAEFKSGDHALFTKTALLGDEHALAHCADRAVFYAAKYGVAVRIDVTPMLATGTQPTTTATRIEAAA
jgi:hypothetical protein